MLERKGIRSHKTWILAFEKNALQAMILLSFGVDTEYRTSKATHFMLNIKKETLERSAKRTLDRFGAW
jgi:hypothetical protein